MISKINVTMIFHSFHWVLHWSTICFFLLNWWHFCLSRLYYYDVNLFTITFSKQCIYVLFSLVNSTILGFHLFSSTRNLINRLLLVHGFDCITLYQCYLLENAYRVVIIYGLVFTSWNLYCIISISKMQVICCIVMVIQLSFFTNIIFRWNTFWRFLFSQLYCCNMTTTW